MTFRSPGALVEVWRERLAGVEIVASVAEWAEKYRWLSGNASANSGQWSTELTPYLRAVMDAASVDHPARKIVFKKSNQVGGTEAILNILGYRIHQWPAPLMIVLPRNEDVAEYTETRVDPMIEHSAVLSALVGRTELVEEGADNAAVKRFPGGVLFVRGSRSRATYRSDPICVAVLDDVDAFAENPEGDHVVLAERRTNTYSERAAKIIVVSTPTDQHSSIVEREYQQSSQNLYWVPCPHCGAYQVLWRRALRWVDDNPATAHFVCQHCNNAIYEHHKADMIAHGQWRPQRPQLAGVVEGYWIWAAYAPSAFRRWSDLAASWLEATRVLRAKHDHTKLRATINLDWAETFVPPSARRLDATERDVFNRREPPFHPASLPLVTITAGTDVQGSRLEISFYGWGDRDEAWMLEHVVLKGIIEEDQVWDQWQHLLIERGARALCVDASSFTDLVKAQVTKRVSQLFRAGCAVWVVKGREGHGSLWPKMVLPGNLQDGRCETVTIAVDAGKDWLYGSLYRVTQPGPAFIHFSTDQPEAFFTQLFAEREVGLDDKRKRTKYIKVEGRHRNEALDCAVYARAALLGRAELDADIQIRVLGMGADTPSPSSPAPSVPSPAPPAPSGGIKKNWVTRRVL